MIWVQVIRELAQAYLRGLHLLRPIHQYSYHNRGLITQSVACGCFYCLAIFSPNEIAEWTDEAETDDETAIGLTALCPKCGTDSVLPDNAPGVRLNSGLLAKMNKCFF
jgi:hypothetical protein